ncbi:2-oxo acid dehydrogenase subunit E2 [Bacteroidetes bacterium endosymbiont of Geopemphigus sp.]|uniref:2-oxo acid dehydrogenase subunit E2 n=1 Tax=Bacteroidetes bacterium endosymbiont of Geopemphigus sp. TaxID=2047937 RepID=UPI000CD054A8|nr:2-oxo acid dehydrogenase subunit E2 [Bacteroidetes bacterium endosymbiont of Geopemphigus sp.]
MAELITMPRLSDTMEEGTVVKWHKQTGDKVSEGDLLAEIETDKAVQEFESEYDGYLLHLGVPEGKSAAVNTVLAVIGKKGEDISELLSGNSVQPGQESSVNTANKKFETSPASKAKDLPKGLEVITMPRLSDTMEEGTVVKWHKQTGDKVSEGDLLAEIETDKAVQEFESEYDGYLLYLGVPEGKSAAIDTVLAVIGPQRIDMTNILLSSIGKKNDANQAQIDFSSLTAEKNNASKDKNQAISANDGTRIFASPLAKKIAQERSISLAEIKGSGENGRIVKKDLENYQPQATQKIQNLTLTQTLPSRVISSPKSREVPNSSMRKIISKRLSESKFAAPHYYLMIEVDMQNAVQSRKAINENLKYGKISFNDLVIKAAAMALKMHPQINTSWQEDKIIYHGDINIGVAVAVEDGLLVPVILQADQKNLREISAEVKDKAGRARVHKMQTQEMEGSTFTISNLGMFGIETFTSIINQPNSCILSVGAILEKPVVKNAQIIPRNLMKLSLACDHRTVDGATGSAYLQELKKLLENPVVMIA